MRPCRFRKQKNLDSFLLLLHLPTAPLPSASCPRLAYSYDANNNLTGLTNVGQASSLSWTYDAYHRVSSYKDADGNLIQYRYDANGNITNLAYPGGKIDQSRVSPGYYSLIVNESGSPKKF